MIRQIPLFLIVSVTLFGLQFDAQALEVASATPANGASNVALDADILLTFDAGVQPATVGPNIEISGHQGERINFGSGASGALVTLNPDRDFFPGEVIEVSITSGVLEVTTNTPADPLVFRFRAVAPAGHKNFVAGWESAQDKQSTRAAIGDFNRDGFLDVAVTAGGSVDVRFNDQSASFDTSNQSLGTNAGDVQVADVNNNGRQDLFIAVGTGNTADQLFLNDGTGQFTDSGLALGGARNTNGAAFGDIDGDGDQDLVLCQVGNDDILKNNGSGVFTIFDTINAGASDVVLADLDKDGDLDAVYIESNGVEVFTNNGSGTFSMTQSLFAGSFNRELDTGDVNGDGFVDVIIGAASSSQVLLNNGTGTLLAPTAIATTDADGVKLADIDSDDDLDAIFSCADSTVGATNQIFLNDGAGNFSDSGLAPGEKNSKSLVAGDFDGDGDIDVYFANSETMSPAQNDDGFDQVWLNAPVPAPPAAAPGDPNAALKASLKKKIKKLKKKLKRAKSTGLKIRLKKKIKSLTKRLRAL